MMYLRINKLGHVDGVWLSASSVPDVPPGDTLYEFDSDVNPTKTIEVTQNVQAVDPVTGQPLFNADGTPQWETTNALDQNGNPIPVLDENGKPEVDAKGNPVYEQVVVTQQVQETVYLLSNPTEFTLGDFAGMSYVEVGSIDQARKNKKAAITAAFSASLVAGFQSSADGTARTYTLDGTAYSRINGYLAIVNAGEGVAERSWFAKDGTQVQLTPTQFVQFATDAFAFYDSQYAHMLSKHTAVDNAQTIDDVNAIQW